jgi:hypothetical protein
MMQQAQEQQAHMQHVPEAQVQQLVDDSMGRCGVQGSEEATPQPSLSLTEHGYNLHQGLQV